jgi:pantetheine-phosphate adenylyltransferase
MRKAVYAGSFDPLTNGHLWMIEQGAWLFDELTVAVGVNPEKKYTFTLRERLDMVEAAVRPFPDVEVATFENQYLVNYASSIGAGFILRGIRTLEDFMYERGMRHINSDLNSAVATVFLMPPRKIAEVSSSMVKSMVGPEHWRATVKKYVPEAVLKKFVEKFGEA